MECNYLRYILGIGKLISQNCLLIIMFPRFDLNGAVFFDRLFVLVENRGIYDPNLFEGDMILSPKQRYNAEHGRDVFGSDRKRGASKFPLWPYGVLVYTVDSSLGE